MLLLIFALGLALCLPALLPTSPAHAQDPVVEVTVEFEESTYTVAETDISTTTDVTENAVEVTVTLSADPLRTVIIPITTTNEGGATNSDYSGVQASVTINSGATSTTFTFTATADTVDDDEDKVKLSFGTLPAGVTAGTTAETIVSITDDDYPNITVSFGAATYSADEGGDSISVFVKLSASPERDFLRIPFTAMLQGGALAADYEFRDGVNVNANDREVEVRFTAIQDTDEDHGESILLGFGTPLPERITASGTTRTTVTIIDDDPAVDVEFGETSYSFAEGQRAVVTVNLSADPKRPLFIPIAVTGQGGADVTDHAARESFGVNFAAGELSHVANIQLFQDTDADDGESLLLSFGTLPPGVSGGTDDQTTVTIIDDDPAVTVKFDSTTYSVGEGDDVEVTVTLSADPMRPLTIPISAESDGSTTAADTDYDIPESVTFNSGDTSATFTFETTENTTSDHGKELDISFGASLPPGVTRASSNRTTTVTIIDDDPAVTVTIEHATYEVVEGESLDVNIVLSEEPHRPVAIPVTITDQGGADSDDHNLLVVYIIDIPATHFSGGVSFRVSRDTLVERGEGVEIAIGSDLPPGVTLGANGVATVNFIDDDPAVTVEFGATTYSVAEGDSVEVTVTLSADPQRTVTIPISAASAGSTTAADDDYDIPDSVTIDSGATSTTFTFTTTGNITADHGKELDISIGTLPPGVTASGTTTTTVTIIDDDPAIAVGIRPSTAEVEEGEYARFLVEFPGSPVRPVSIPLVYTYLGGADAADLTNMPTNVVFGANDDGSEVLVLIIADDDIADHGESIQVGFGADLPPGVSVRSSDATATITIIDDDPAVTVSFGAATYSADEGESVDVTVTLSADPMRPLTIPITATNQSGASSADYSVPDSVTFASGDTSKTISFTATDDTIDDDDEKVRLSFGTFPPGVSAGGTRTTTVSINDDDDPDVRVRFDANSLAGTEGAAGVLVELYMNMHPERTVTIPLTVTLQGGASSADYSGVPASVVFGPTDTIASFTVTVVDDDIDDDGESVKIAFGALPSRVTAIANETTVNLNDNDTRGVTITPTALSIVELAWGDYTVVLDTEPTGEVTITITDPTDHDEVEVPTGSLTFTTDNWDTAQSVRVNVSGDYEDEPDETATITHSASGGDYGSVTVDSVVVTIEDDDATPVITGSASKNFPEFEYDADAATFDKTVATYSATDGDTNPETTTWDVSGTDADKFTITMDSGVLSFNDPPDFENPTDSGSGNTYEVTVEASDGTNTGTFDVTVTVTAVNERPNFTDASKVTLAYETRYYEVASENARIILEVNGTDPETDDITWSLGGADKDDFSLFTHVSLANFVAVYFKNQPDYEQPADADQDNNYEFILKASDGSKTSERAYTVILDDLNERPDIEEDTVADYKEIEFDFTGTPGSVHTFTATDYDAGDTFTWSLEGDDADDFEIGSSTGILTFRQVSGSDPLPDFEDAEDDDSDNTYEITVKATDDDSTPLSSTHAVTVKVTNVNEKPEFTGTPETAISYDEKKTENVADYNARDEEGPVTWSLTGTDRGDFAISTDGIVTFATTPNYEDAKDSNTDNVYTFNVVATDTQSGSTRRNATTSVTVTVNDLEEAGVITVSNLNPGVGDEITFKLSDPDGGLKDISWNLESRASSTASWSAVSGWFTSVSQATLAAYSVTEDVTGHELRMRVDYADRRTTATDDSSTLLVNEGQDKTAESEVTAAVTADPIVNAPPRFRGGGTFSIAEGEAGRNVGTPLVVSDRDNDTLRFGIEAGAGDDVFAINATSGQLSLLKAVDFEHPPAAGFYLITVTLHDGKGADGNAEADPVVDTTTGVSVTVTDVEEDGVVTLSSDEPETGMPLDATLEDGDGSVSGEKWQWARSGDGRTNWINIAGETSGSYTPTEDDEDFYLRARVEYTDNRGSGKSAEGVTTGPVPSENRRPAFPDTETGERTVSENTRAGVNVGAPVAAVDPERNRLTYSLTGTDADAFTIVERTGQIRVKDALDYETKDSYSVTVNVHDGRDGAGAASTDVDNTQDVTITVENVEEAGTVTLTTATENISARVEVTATLTDPDESVSGVTWQWSQSPNGRTGWANIGGSTSESYTPTDDHEGRYIRATASYTDGHGANKTAHGVSPRRVEEPPPVNSPPAFPSTENGRREVPENSAGATTFGTPVAATDLNAGDSAVNDPLVYSLTGTDAASFTIDAGTGQLALAQDVDLDYEGKRSYRVTVQVTDGRDRNGDDDNDVIDDTINVTINVTNVNEAPTVSGEATATFAENDSGAVATYTGSDPERHKLTWSVSGADGDSFAMTDRGHLHFASPPSYEGGKDTYAVTVVATDEGDPGLTGTFEVTVTVTDVEEEGAVTITPPRGWTDTQFSAALTDGDGGLAQQTWQWARSTNRSGWTDIAGATSSAYTATADDVGNYLRVSTEYTDGRGSGKTAEAVLTARIADAADRPATNNAPEFAGATTTRSINQGTAPRRSIGAAVRARDADGDDVLIYSLGGTDAGSFDIDPRTGQLRTKSVLLHDPQGQNTYTVTVNVHDGFDEGYAPSTTADDSIDVTITVTARRPSPTPTSLALPPPRDSGGGAAAPANRSPEFREGSTTGRSIAENTPANATIGEPLTATDPDGDTLTYSLRGADAESFTINAVTGQIRVGDGTTLDYEADKNVYEVTVIAEDSSGATAEAFVTISVTNVGLAGMVGQYDRDDNGAIDRDEAIAAAVDYFSGVINKQEAIAVIRVYFAG